MCLEIRNDFYLFYEVIQRKFIRISNKLKRLYGVALKSDGTPRKYRIIKLLKIIKITEKDFCNK